MTEWKHVNFEQRTWFIPAANTKGERGRKCGQLVYLSDFTLDQFKQLHALTGDSEWAFPARYKEGHVCELFIELLFATQLLFIHADSTGLLKINYDHHSLKNEHT